jgi:hypothetical protein
VKTCYAFIWRRIKYAIWLGLARCNFRVTGSLDNLWRKKTYVSTPVDAKFVPTLGILVKHKLSSKNYFEEVGRIVNGSVTIFNFTLLNANESWRCDPVSGFIWGRRNFFRDSRVRYGTGIDIKNVWELGRLQFLVIVSLAYKESANPKYAEFVVSTIIQFSNANLLGDGPHWTCNMDVAIRLANISVSLANVFGSSVYKQKHGVLKDIVNKHIWFVFKNLENRSAITSNHFVANLAGLYVALKFAARDSYGDAALEFVKRNLNSEIKKQTLSCGLNFELATGYHLLVTEMFFFCYALDPLDFNSKFISLLRASSRAIGVLCSDLGYYPLLGDNDSGHFVDFKRRQFGKPEAIKQLSESFASALGVRPVPLGVFAFRDAGIIVVRGNYYHLTFKDGRKGQGGRGGHSHSDALSITLVAGDQNVIVDPGTNRYTADLQCRQRFRSKCRHNSIHWPNCGQSNVLSQVFENSEVSDSAVIVRESLSGLTRLEGWESCESFYHKREILIDDRNRLIEIHDSVSDVGACLQFQLFGNVTHFSESTVSLNGLLITVIGGELEVITSEVAVDYGVSVDLPMLRVKLIGRNATTKIHPVR